MATLGEDDDAWLYGDSNEEKKAELERITEQLHENTNGEAVNEFSVGDDITAKTIDGVQDDDEEDDKEAGELSGEEENRDVNNQTEHRSEDSDSDDDEVQVTIGDIKPPSYGYGGTPVNLNIKRPFGNNATTGPSSKTKGIDMDSLGSINGVPVYEFNLDTLEDKPWRKPGADITDYFNYGFNEDSWKIYCERQRKLRVDNNVVSKTQPVPGKDQQIPVATVNENSKYSGLGGLTKKAGPPPGRKMSGGIDVIGGGTPSLPSRRPANSPRENVIQVIGGKGTFEPPPGMPPLHLPPPHIPPPFLLPPPDHNLNVAPPTGPIPPPGLPPPNIPPPQTGNLGQDNSFQDSFDTFNQSCFVPPHSLPNNDRSAHYDDMPNFYNGNQGSHNQFDVPSESTQQSWSNSPRDTERSRERDRERERDHEERDRDRERNHNRGSYSQWEYSRERSSGRSSGIEEEHERRRFREYHDRGRDRERGEHNWDRERDREDRYERDRDRERRHRDHHRDREERYRDRSRRRHHDDDDHEHRSSRHKHKRSKREKEEETTAGESQEGEATNTSTAGGGGASSGGGGEDGVESETKEKTT